MPSASIGVVVAHDVPRTVEEVAEVLEASPDLFVAGVSPAAAGGQVVVAGGAALAAFRPGSGPLVALAGPDAIADARAALAAGAADIVRWPQEADRLAGAVRRAAGAVTRGRVIAVAGARGGSGASTAAAAIAAALDEAVVVDLEGGQRALVEADPGPPPDLGPDPSPDRVEAALVPHVGGARCLHAPPASSVHAVLRAARAIARVALVDCGRARDGAARAAFGSADARLVLVPNDVAGVRGALALRDVPPWRYAVLRLRREGVAVRDVAAAIGSEPLAVVPADRRLARAADLGALPPRASRAWRALAGIAEEL